VFSRHQLIPLPFSILPRNRPRLQRATCPSLCGDRVAKNFRVTRLCPQNAGVISRESSSWTHRENVVVFPAASAETMYFVPWKTRVSDVLPEFSPLSIRRGSRFHELHEPARSQSRADNSRLVRKLHPT